MTHAQYMTIMEDAAKAYFDALTQARKAYDFVLSGSVGPDCPTVVEAFNVYRRAEWNAYADFIATTSKAYREWL